MLHSSTVESPTLELLKKIQKLPSIVGGTALALQIGHRKSVDLDFFGHIADTEVVIEELRSIGNLTILKSSAHIHIFVLNNVKIDIVDYSYKWLSDFIECDGIRLADLNDIAAMKLAAITGRGTKKDFIDLYFLSERYTLPQMLSFYREKYPDGSDFMVLKSLSYFDDADPDPLPYMFRAVTWEDVKSRVLSLL